MVFQKVCLKLELHCNSSDCMKYTRKPSLSQSNCRQRVYKANAMHMEKHVYLMSKMKTKLHVSVQAEMSLPYKPSTPGAYSVFRNRAWPAMVGSQHRSITVGLPEIDFT